MTPLAHWGPPRRKLDRPPGSASQASPMRCSARPRLIVTHPGRSTCGAAAICDETGLSKHARRERPSSREKGANESEIRARSEPTFLSPVGPLPSRRRLAPSAEAHARHRRRRSHGVVSGTGTAQRGSPTVAATASWLHRTVTNRRLRVENSTVADSPLCDFRQPIGTELREPE